MAVNIFPKDPDAVLDYAVDWLGNGWLAAGETITTSTWIVPGGIVKNSDTHDTGKATIWLSGGTNGASYTLTNRIVTNQGRTDDRSIVIQVNDR